MIIKKYVDFIRVYLNASRWLFKRHSFLKFRFFHNQYGTVFMNYLLNYPQVIENYGKVVNKLKLERKNRKIRVCFLVSEPAKWNMQSLYDELSKSEDFHPFIIVTNVKNLINRPPYKHLLDFFRSVSNDVEVGWNETLKDGVELKRFSPDIVFYQQPWYIYSNQDIPVVSKFALTFYVSYAMEDPYVVAKAHLLNFYGMLYRFLCFRETYKTYFLSMCPFRINNLVSIDGHPKLDVYSDYCSSNYTHKYVIYAPHHSLAQTSLSYSTFQWSGFFILEWAKSHLEIDWVFKPHPRFKLSLAEEGIMTQMEIDDYYNEWGKLGIVYEDGNYFDLFKASRCLITDCGSFLTEYLPTQMPIIHLRNPNAKEC